MVPYDADDKPVKIIMRYSIQFELWPVTHNSVTCNPPQVRLGEVTTFYSGSPNVGQLSYFLDIKYGGANLNSRMVGFDRNVPVRTPPLIFFPSQ